MPSNQNYHYEILGQKGSSWTVVEIKDDRKEAEESAEKLWKSRRFSSVKVLKEQFDPKENIFSSVEIFNRGQKRKISKYDESKTVTPCLTPDNLYSMAGRASIWELLHNSLYEWRITPTELLHSWNHYNRLYNAGTRLQNAVQRTAVAFEEAPESIQERMRKLYKVIDSAVEIIKANKDNIPSLELGRLKPITNKLEKVSNKKFLMAACLTNYLEPAVTLEDKLGRLAVFLAPSRPDWVMSIFDQIIAELMMHRGLLRQLLVKCESRGAILVSLAYWSAGQLERAASMLDIKFSEDVLQINKYIFSGHLPEVAQVLNKQLKNELSSSEPLVADGTIHDQFEVLYQLNRALGWLADNQARFIGMDQDIASRQSRLINSQSVAEYLTEFDGPILKAEALLDLERVTVSNQVVRLIANFMLPMLSTPENEARLMSGQKNVTGAMQDIAKIQRRVLRSKFNEMHKRKISEKLDDFCKTIMRKSDMLGKLDRLDETLYVKMNRLLDLLCSDTFTEGVARMSVSQRVQQYLQKDDFQDLYLADVNEDQRDQELARLRLKINDADLSNMSTLPSLVTQAVEAEEEEDINTVISKSTLYGKKASEDLW